MTATFLVHVNIKDQEEIPDIADEIEHELTMSGFDVESVEPWERQDQSLPSEIPPTL